MTEIEKQELREALVGQRKNVLADVSRHGVKKGAGAGAIADETERADIIAENMVEHQLGFSESKLLEKIDAPLDRFIDQIFTDFTAEDKVIFLNLFCI